METRSSQTTQQKRKRSGRVLRFEPQNLDLFEGNPNFIDSFRQVGCYRFCEKMQGYHKQIAIDFALNFDGIKTKVGPLEFAVTPDSIAAATEIPRQGEKAIQNSKEITSCLSYNHKRGLSQLQGRRGV